MGGRGESGEGPIKVYLTLLEYIDVIVVVDVFLAVLLLPSLAQVPVKQG